MYEPCFLNYRCTYDPAPVSIQTKRRKLKFLNSDKNVCNKEVMKLKHITDNDPIIIVLCQNDFSETLSESVSP